ncbi:unnamed protein product [Allacma fusca]|uniref:Uncharacterized protein n=1 Tax=Allacma fusca TaxID=39272 RepID=A0A8J2K9T7_9HEXA|nr:unnamed protein product [Allacma fusca]
MSQFTESTIVEFPHRYFLESYKPDDLKAWTYTNGSTITINETALQEFGFSLKTVRCCYKVISRVEQSLQNYDEYADRRTITSKDCTSLKNDRTIILEEFVRVQCISAAWPMHGDVLYRQYHALFQPHKNANTTRKIKRWKTSEKEAPPNVFILGIDSMSSANFGRTMPKTKQVLKDLGAREFLGYTKGLFSCFSDHQFKVRSV